MVKRMRKVCSLLVLMVLLCVIFVGCGSTAPEESMIVSDIAAHLLDQYGNDYELVEYSTTQSYTEDRTYSATVGVIAEGTYARIYLTTELLYTKYDQGWICDYVDMWLSTYEIVNYPSDAEIETLCNARDNKRGFPATYSDINFWEDTVTCVGYVDMQYNEYYALKGSVNTHWRFSFDENKWIYDFEDDNYYGVLTYNIEGSFKIHNGNSSRIYVRNQNETSMEVKNTSEKDEWVYVELEKYTNDITPNSLKDGIRLTYVGYMENGHKVTVELASSSSKGIQITTDYQYSRGSDWGYFDTFIPAG